jgi:SAM-dependent methyltransferase
VNPTQLPSTTPRAPFLFYAGVFLLCMSVLMQQIVQTRILSVMAYYHLAFFSISMAMFGLTAGALWVYFRKATLTTGELFYQLSWTTTAYAATTALSFAFQATSYAGLVPWATVVFIWLKLIALMAPPFFFAGAAISLALTRSPYPVGIVYGVDLVGAAFGCLVVLLLLNNIDAPSALFAVAAVAALGGWCFYAAGATAPAGPVDRWVRYVSRPAPVAIGLLVLAVANSLTSYGIQPIATKGRFEERWLNEFEKWNSFSRIVASEPWMGPAFLWAPSPKQPPVDIEQRQMNIDGEAGTHMHKFNGDLKTVDFLKYDVTNLAYNIRNEGRSAVIGIGGGRDMLSAYLYGFRDITGVDINPIFVDLHTKPEYYRSFSGLADLPNVRFIADEARSWFARTQDRFNLIQMSMVDTWAATGAGGFSLSENGLYTVEAWTNFLRALAPNGVFTVSRWYAPDNVNETGRVVSLALGALFNMGVQEPRNHIFLVGQKWLSTIIVSPQPLSAADVAGLVGASNDLEHAILVSPDREPASALLSDLLASKSIDDLTQRASGYALDITPPTDSRPFFFNQLRLTKPQYMFEALRQITPGVIHGNIMAGATLLLIIVLSAILVVWVVIWPARGAVRDVERKLVTNGTFYFLMIGFGFMLIEIGLIQRMAIFLGHPIYALAIVLFSVILSTGLGSMLSERWPLSSFGRFAAWGAVLGIYVLALPIWLGSVLNELESGGLLVRALTAVGVIAPAGLLMGFGFPTGMRLTLAWDPRPTPWFWGINGAAGVLASGFAVACSITASIDVTLRLGALCYLLLIASSYGLYARHEVRTVGLSPDRRTAS